MGEKDLVVNCKSCLVMFLSICPDGSESQGRISYKNMVECRYFPFNIHDVEGDVTLAVGDKVSFQMVTVRSGNL